MKTKTGLLSGLVGGLALTALVAGSPATAADVAAPVYKAAPAVVWSWTGFYIGGDVGAAMQGGSGTSNFFQNDGDPAFDNNIQKQSPNPTSAIGGIHAGYNWQFAPNWVAGLEGDWQWIGSRYSFCRQTDIDSVACSDNNRGFANISGETRSIGTVRGRLGYAFDHVMVYGTGGVAFADIKTTLGVNCLRDGCGDSGTTNATASSSSTVRTGWVAGAGLEWMLTQNWLVRTEYLHADFGNLSNTLNLATANCINGGPCGVSWSRDLHYDIVRAGISYKFGP